MTILAAILYAIILSALLGGQARLIWRSIQSGEAGLGRFAAQRATSPIVYWIWMAVYATFLVYVAAYLIVGLIGFAREGLA